MVLFIQAYCILFDIIAIGQCEIKLVTLCAVIQRQLLPSINEVSNRAHFTEIKLKVIRMRMELSRPTDAMRPWKV